MKQYHKNPRQITDKQFKKLNDTLLRLGDLSGIVHDLNSDEIIGGNQRARAFNINDCEIVTEHELPEPDEQGSVAFGYVVWQGKRYAYRAVRWTPAQCEEANIVANKAGGTWDFDILANEFEIGDLFEWGFEPFEFGMVDGEQPPAGADAEPQVNRAEELREEWQVETGQLWRLPSRTAGQEHRLICGDCTDAVVVERLMDGEKIDCITTDPPYGVDYDGGTTKRIKLDGDESPALYFPALNTWRGFCNDHVAFYLWYADGDQAVSQAGYVVRRNLIWNKNQAQYGALSQQYKQKHEPFFYGHLKGKVPYWAGDATEITVWDIARDSVNDLHPTQKPQELYARAIKNSSRPGNTVFDGFCGSAPAIIAAENLSRQCRAVEIAPGYVAVSLQRYLDAFGIRAELVDA